MKDTPNCLDRISLDVIHDSIVKIAKHPNINAGKIAVIGGSKGGVLVLNLASRFDNISAKVAIVPSDVSFPALTYKSNSTVARLNDYGLEYHYEHLAVKGNYAETLKHFDVIFNFQKIISNNWDVTLIHCIERPF